MKGWVSEWCRVSSAEPFTMQLGNAHVKWSDVAGLSLWPRSETKKAVKAIQSLQSYVCQWLLEQSWIDNPLKRWWFSQETIYPQQTKTTSCRMLWVFTVEGTLSLKALDRLLSLSVPGQTESGMIMNEQMEQMNFLQRIKILFAWEFLPFVLLHQHRKNVPFPGKSGAVLQRERSKELLHHVLDSLAHGSQHHQNSGPPDGMVEIMVRIHVDWLQFHRSKRHRRSICRLCLGGLISLHIFHWLPQEELKLVREGLRACLQLLLQNFLQKEAGLDIESRTPCVSRWFCFEMVRSFITTVTAHLQRQAKPSPGDTRSKSFSAESTIMKESAFGCIWMHLAMCIGWNNLLGPMFTHVHPYQSYHPFCISLLRGFTVRKLNIYPIIIQNKICTLPMKYLLRCWRMYH